MPDYTSPHGLTWAMDETWGYVEPKWTVELDLTVIAAVVSERLGTAIDRQQISLHAEGVYNKVYKVDAGASIYAMRISLPVDFPYKIPTEVDTMTFLSETTSTPLPRVLAFDTTNDNLLGFPYILMDFVEDRPILDVWPTLSASQKAEFTTRLAQYQAELFDRHFDSIGGIRTRERISPAPAAIILFLFAAMLLIPHLLLFGLAAWAASLARSTPHQSLYTPDCISRGESYFMDGLTPRGPFRNSNAWLRARLEACLIRHASDPTVVAMAQRLLLRLPQLFPESAVDICVLAHQDMHGGNILVDATGTPTAILDWEFTPVLPAWYACQPPEVFVTQDIPDPEEGDEDYDYDTYQCDMFNTYRPLFEETMGLLQPRWTELWRACDLERRFAMKVDNLEKGHPQTERSKEREDRFDVDFEERGPMFHLWSV